MEYKNKLSYLYLSLLSQSFTILTTNKHCSSELASHNKRLRLLTATLIIKRLWGNNKNAFKQKNSRSKSIFVSRRKSNSYKNISYHWCNFVSGYSSIDKKIMFLFIVIESLYYFSNIIWMYTLLKNEWNFPKGHKSNLSY